MLQVDEQNEYLVALHHFSVYNCNIFVVLIVAERIL